MEKSETVLDSLLQQVEFVFGRKPQGPSDFEALIASIFSITHQNIGISTIKRLWGYVHTDTSPRSATLDVLALYVGYANYEIFCNSISTKEKVIESNLLLGEHVNGESLLEGDTIKVIWQPDRMCIFRSLGHAHFVVEESHNSKLAVGDSFTCHTFINGSPLYLTDLITQNATCPVSYVCGKDNGVTIII